MIFTQSFFTNGTFTVPSGMVLKAIALWGGGGGGGGGGEGGQDYGSGGGGGGGFTLASGIVSISGIVPLNYITGTFTHTIGVGGDGGRWKGGETIGYVGQDGFITSVSQGIWSVAAYGGSGGTVGGKSQSNGGIGGHGTIHGETAGGGSDFFSSGADGGDTYYAFNNPSLVAGHGGVGGYNGNDGVINHDGSGGQIPGGGGGGAAGANTSYIGGSGAIGEVIYYYEQYLCTSPYFENVWQCANDGMSWTLVEDKCPSGCNAMGTPPSGGNGVGSSYPCYPGACSFPSCCCSGLPQKVKDNADASGVIMLQCGGGDNEYTWYPVRLPSGCADGFDVSYEYGLTHPCAQENVCTYDSVPCSGTTTTTTSDPSTTTSTTNPPTCTGDCQFRWNLSTATWIYVSTSCDAGCDCDASQLPEVGTVNGQIVDVGCLGTFGTTTTTSPSLNDHCNCHCSGGIVPVPTGSCCTLQDGHYICYDGMSYSDCNKKFYSSFSFTPCAFRTCGEIPATSSTTSTSSTTTTTTTSAPETTFTTLTTTTSTTTSTTTTTTTTTTPAPTTTTTTTTTLEPCIPPTICPEGTPRSVYQCNGDADYWELKMNCCPYAMDSIIYTSCDHCDLMYVDCTTTTTAAPTTTSSVPPWFSGGCSCDQTDENGDQLDNQAKYVCYGNQYYLCAYRHCGIGCFQCPPTPAGPCTDCTYLYLECS